MTRADTRSGQIVLVLVFAILALVFLLLMNMDIFVAARDKTRLQNAGDAAALAAARQQGLALNLLGELNLLHLTAACETNYAAMAGICALQERLAIALPCLALYAANEVARANLEKNPPPEDVCADMRSIVDYCATAALPRTSPTWPTLGADYAAMLRAACAHGCWALADNAEILPAAVTEGGHPLYSRAFYDNAAARNWPALCRTVFHGHHAQAAATLLSWPGWGEIPPAVVSNDMTNAEFFGLGVQRGFFTGVADPDALAQIAAEQGLDTSLVNAETIRRLDVLNDIAFPWTFYEPTRWRPWYELETGGDTRFPLRSPVKDHYDVKGAVAAARVAARLVPLSEVSVTNTFAWSSAAKPFGDYAGRRVIDLFSAWDGSRNDALVLPSFTHVRLVPLGGAGESSLGTADKDWIKHVRVHVPGKIRDPACAYCRILNRWDEPAFTRAGGEYLSAHAHDEVCQPPTSGPGSGGGTRHAH